MAKKSGLGKGLGSLMGAATVEAGTTPDAVLPIDLIERNPDQPRKEFNEEKLQELADSIKANGVLQPILVRPKGERYEIVAGERRWQASQRAGLTEMPVLVREVTDDEVFQLALIENLQRSDLNPIEEAQGYRKLISEKALTQEQLAQMLAKSRSTVANTLRLLDLPEEVQDLTAAGALTPGHARAILSVPTPEARVRLARKVTNEGLSVRQTEHLAPLFEANETEVTRRQPTPASFKRAARTLRRALGSGVRVKSVRGKNKIEIEFRDEDDLARLVSQLTSAAAPAQDEADATE